MTRYDPFAPSHSGDDSHANGYHETSGVLFRPEPEFLSSPLAALEWKVPPHGERKAERNHKRPRMSSAAPPVGDRPHHGTASPPRVVEKIVEKIVHVPKPGRISIMGGEPLVDDRVRNLVNFILQHVTGPDVEVEAKLGVLVEKQKDVRACDLLPVLCETPIQPEVAAETRFESCVHHTFFDHLNVVLNQRVEATAEIADPSARVMYLRSRELDVFWPGKVRETRSLAAGPDGGLQEKDTLRVQRKTRLGDLNFVCPGCAVDVRYSASLEEEAKIPPGVPEPARRRAKDRISYKFDALSVDITAVETTDPDANMFGHTTHEIEVEVESGANLFVEVQKYRAGDPSSRLFGIATSLVNTVRLIMEEIQRVTSYPNPGHPNEQPPPAGAGEAVTAGRMGVSDRPGQYEQHPVSHGYAGHASAYPGDPAGRGAPYPG